jgi:hypothetical protein
LQNVAAFETDIRKEVIVEASQGPPESREATLLVNLFEKPCDGAAHGLRGVGDIVMIDMRFDGRHPAGCPVIMAVDREHDKASSRCC